MIINISLNRILGQKKGLFHAMVQISRRTRRDDPMAILSAHRDDLKRRYHVKKIGLFGSLLRGEARPESDADVLVEFQGGHATLQNLIALRDHLQALFHRKVDLVTIGGLSPLMRPYSEKEVAWCEEAHRDKRGEGDPDGSRTLPCGCTKPGGHGGGGQAGIAWIPGQITRLPVGEDGRHAGCAGAPVFRH